MSREPRPRSRLASTVVVATLAAVACNHARPEVVVEPPSTHSSPRRGTPVRIDGPGKSPMRPGDSVVIILNDREAWRGVYDPHPRHGELQAALDHLIPGTDSIVSSDVWTGRDVAAKYHVGGTRPSAIMIRTVPPPE